MIGLFCRAPFGPVFATVRRVLRAMAASMHQPEACSASAVLGLVPLQYDFCALAPDQARETRYGLGRRDAHAAGADR